MRRARSGMTLLEVSVVAVGVAFLFMVLASVIGSGRKSDARTSNRLRALAELNNFTKNMSEPEFFRTLVLQHSDSSELRECLYNGCAVGTQGSFAVEDVDSSWSLLKPSYAWQVVGPSLFRVTISFPKDRVVSAGQNVSFYHSRNNFLNADFSRKDSDCGEGFDEVPNVVAGIDTSSGTFLCRAPFSDVDAWENNFIGNADETKGQEWKK